MPSELRLLLVRDCSQQPEALEALLRGVGLACSVEPCGIAADPGEYLARGPWDAILWLAAGPEADRARADLERREGCPPVVAFGPDDSNRPLGEILRALLRALARARTDRERYRQLFDNAPDGMAVFVGDRLVWANPAFARLHGCDGPELRGMTIAELVVPQEVPIHRARTLMRLQGEPVSDRYETMLLRRDGSQCPIEASVATLRWNGQDAEQIVARDISARRQIEETSRRGEPFQRLAELTADALLVHDQGVIVEVNQTFEQLVGYPREELVGRNAEFLATEETWRTAMEVMAKGLESPVELEGVRRDGSHFFARYQAKTVDYQGRVLRVLFIRDLTELRRAEEDLRLAVEACQLLEERKSNFLMNVSHELRTPLVAIQGYVELLLEKTAPPEKREKWLRTIHLSTKRLERIISNLVESSDLHARQMIFDFRKVDLSSLIALAITTLGPLTHKKEQTVERRIQSGLPRVRADQQRLISVLLNLLDNAVKFSPPGSRIVMAAEQLDDAVLLSVRDQGIGIPLQSQERIFDRFYQVDDSSTREHEGSGIGLSLVRENVEAHGGRVWVESAPGQGSTFYVSLPIGPG